jgi:hypothetical protein
MKTETEIISVDDFRLQLN